MTSVEVLLDDANDTRFGLVEDHIINLVVAMYERRSVLWLLLRITEESYHFLVMRNGTDWNSSFLILGLCLDLGDGVECLELPIEEVAAFPIR